MRPRLLLLAATLPLALAARADAEEEVSVEVRVAGDVHFVHERIPVRLRVGVPEEFLRERMVQMFQRRLDVPVQVAAPWIPQVAWDEPRPGETAATIVLGGRVASVRRAEEGGLLVLDVEGSLVADSPGPLVLEAPELRYAFATRFGADFAGGRVALDRHAAAVQGSSLTLRIEPLPEAGRPEEFTGVVGRLEVSADAAPRRVRAGESLTLTLRFAGDGDLARLVPPRLAGLEDFHVLGRLDEADAAGRTFRYELVPLHARVDAIPPIRVAYFDPAPPGRYVPVATEPIPIEVEPAPAAAPEPRGAPPPGSRPLPWLLLAALGLVAVGAVVGLLRARRRRAPAASGDDPAAQEFRLRIDDETDDPADALSAYLASRLGCSRAAVVAPDLAVRLVVAGVPRALAERTAALLERFVAARYGGERPGAQDRLEARRTVDELVAARAPPPP